VFFAVIFQFREQFPFLFLYAFSKKSHCSL